MKENDRLSPKQQERSLLVEDIFNRGVEDILTKGELHDLLQSGNRLTIKYGIDATDPDLHLGHAVGLLKLAQFHELGHRIILLFGDFTAQIGDPSGKTTAVRRSLTPEQINENITYYRDQVGRVLDLNKKDNPVEIHSNNEWLSTLPADEFLRLADRFTLGRFLAKRTFAERLAQKEDIYLHELLYSIVQAYDSVALQADVEIGGNDQIFNFMITRDIQPIFHQKPEVAIMVPLLPGTDGQKMSKSAYNTINLSDLPEVMYQKALTIPDEVVIDYFDLATDIPSSRVREMRETFHEYDATKKQSFKAILGRELVAMYWGIDAALRF